MADIKKKQSNESDDFEEGYENKPDENSEDFNDDIDIDALQSRLMEYMDLAEFNGTATVVSNDSTNPDTQNNSQESEETAAKNTKTINDVVEEKKDTEPPISIEPKKDEGVFCENDSLEVNEILHMESEITPEIIAQVEARVSQAEQILNNNNKPANAEINGQVFDSHNSENFEQTQNQEINKFLNNNSRPTSFDGYKKYVIYIDPKNEEYIESLSVSERKDIINSILSGEDKKLQKQKQINKRKEFTTHAIIASLCVLLGFPILYKFTNYCLKSTINSYKQAQVNFEKLYRESGKIKMKENLRF